MLDINIDLNNIESNIEDLTIKDLSLNINGINKFNSLYEYFDSIKNKKLPDKSNKKQLQKLLNDNLFWFNEQTKKFKKLSKNEEIQLFDSLRRHSNKIAYQQLILSNLYLVQKIVDQIGIKEGERIEVLDLIMEGVFGLDYAINKYNHLIANRFMSFVPMTIHRYIQRAKATHSNLIKLPIHIYEQVYKINKVISETHINNDEYNKISNLTGIPIGIVTSILKDENHTIYYKEIDHKNYYSIIANIPDNNNIDKSINDKIMLSDVLTLMNTLKPREKDVLRLRYGLDDSNKERTLEEVGIIFGITRERVRQIEKKALDKLRQKLRTIYKYNTSPKQQDNLFNSAYSEMFKKNGISYIPAPITIAHKVFKLFKPQNENDFIEKFNDIAYSVGYTSASISTKYLKNLYSKIIEL